MGAVLFGLRVYRGEITNKIPDPLDPFESSESFVRRSYMPISWIRGRSDERNSTAVSENRRSIKCRNERNQIGAQVITRKQKPL